MLHMRLAKAPRWSAAVMGAVAMEVARALPGLMLLARPVLQTTDMTIVVLAGMIPTAILLAASSCRQKQRPC